MDSPGDDKVLMVVNLLQRLVDVLVVVDRGHVLNRDDILSRVWGGEVYVTPRTVDTHIANLRKKIEDDPEQSHWITGIRGVGYRFNLYESSPNLNQT